MKHSFILMGILIAFIAKPKPLLSQSLIAAKVEFFTPSCDGCDNKDYDTRINILVYGSRGRTAAWINNSWGVEYKDNNSYHDISLKISEGYDSPNLSKSELLSGRMSIYIRPNGHDEWVFQPKLILYFSDRTSNEVSWDQYTRLSQDNRQQWYNFH